MRKFIVEINNSVGASLYNDIVEAENENRALIKVLQEEIICDGDNISIEEMM